MITKSISRSTKTTTRTTETNKNNNSSNINKKNMFSGVPWLFSGFHVLPITESSFLIVLISNCAPFLLFFASEAPDQAPRELKDGTGPRPAGPPGTDGRTKIALKNLICLSFFLVFLSFS